MDYCVHNFVNCFCFFKRRIVTDSVSVTVAVFLKQHTSSVMAFVCLMLSTLSC